jgi:FKBP-type peptidyl-prolyl cis-trans isomerase FkpA
MRLTLLFTILVCAFEAAACSSSSAPSNGGSGGVTTLQTTDVKTGTGTAATAGKTVIVNYTGWLYDPNTADHHGAQFDSSRDPGRSPFSFVLGAGQVIAGWDQGVVGMRVGGQRTLVIPPNLGYGNRANGPIPANSTLVFDVELLDVR